MLAKVGSFTKSTGAATASQPITGVGFQPNLVFFYTVGPTATATWTQHLRHCLGFACNEGGTIKERSLAWSAQDTAANSNVHRMFSNTKVINFHLSGTLLAQADLASFDSDGFTLSWTTNNAIAYQIGYIALQVPDVAIRNFDTSASGSGSITGLSFQPTVIFAIANSGTTYQTTTPTTGIGGGWGAAASGGAWAYQALDATGTATISNATAGQSGYWMVAAGNSTEGTSITNRISLTSLNSDGITYNVNDFALARSNEVLLIGGVSAKVETFNKSTGAATAVQARTSYGFTPKAAIIFSGCKVTDTSVNTQHIRTTVGFSDGTNELSGTSYDTDALADANVNAFFSVTKVAGLNNANSDTISAAADLALDSDGLTLSWTTNDANAHEIMVVALGDIPTPPSVSSQFVNIF